MGQDWAMGVACKCSFRDVFNSLIDLICVHGPWVKQKLQRVESEEEETLVNKFSTFHLFSLGLRAKLHVILGYP